MTKLTLDTNATEKLRQQTQATLPRSVPVPFTEQELEAFETEPDGRTLAEILTDLEWQNVTSTENV